MFPGWYNDRMLLSGIPASCSKLLELHRPAPRQLSQLGLAVEQLPSLQDCPGLDNPQVCTNQRSSLELQI